MTDLRPRNDDLLYDSETASTQGWTFVAVFGSIVAGASLLVGSYLTDRYNPASTGFSTAVRSAKPAEPAPPAVSVLAAPASRNRS